MKIGIQTWGSEGDIRPFIALAGGLSAEGHDVTLAVSGVKKMDFSGLSERYGFKIQNLGYVYYDGDFLFRLGEKILKERNPLKQIQTILTYFFDPIAQDIWAGSQQLCQENEFIIRHFIVYTMGVAAEKKDLPCVSVFPTSPPIPSRYISPLEPISFGKTVNGVLWKLSEVVLNRLFKSPLDKLRRQEGLSPIKSVLQEGWFSKTLNLIAISPVLFQSQSDWEDHFHVCGFFNPPETEDSWMMPESLEQFLKSGPPPVYMTFGAMTEGDPSPENITRLLIDAAFSAGCRAIIQARWEEINEIPDHPDIYRIGRAPHQFIFPKCAAVVHAGGAGTTQSAIKAGCPSVIVAHASDQTRWGMVLKKAGIAPKALHRRSLTSKKLAHSIRAVLDSPEMAGKTREISEKMNREDGVERAIELIEKLC